MEKLLSFLIKKITGSTDFNIKENLQDNHLTLEVAADKKIIGLIIGKEGKTIKSLRKILAVKAVGLDQTVSIEVVEK
jgi:predicted RNA-binding protein YlqC (UPF0109 family)